MMSDILGMRVVYDILGLSYGVCAGYLSDGVGYMIYGAWMLGTCYLTYDTLVRIAGI